MRTRYLSNTAVALAGGFLVVASQAFAYPTFEWLALGIGIVAIIASAGIALKNRGTAQRGVDLAAAAVGAWTIVETLLFNGTTNMWLGFASGAALVGLALIGLTAHEFTTERVVHSIEITNSEATDRDYAHVA